MLDRGKGWLLAMVVLAIVALASCAKATPTPTPTKTPVLPTKTTISATPAPTRPPTLTLPPTTGVMPTPTSPKPPTPAPANMGRVEVKATDAPPKGVTKVMVAAKDIEAHLSGAEEGKWTKLIDDPPAFDLIAIAGVEHVLGSNDIPIGDYTQVRINIDKVVITLEGKDVTATVPSDRVRLVSPFAIVEGQTTVLTIDFDADKSVVVTGSDRVQFKPVVKLIVTRPPAKTPTPVPTTPPPATPTPTVVPATPTATATATVTPGATPTAIPVTPTPTARPTPTVPVPTPTPTKVAGIPSIPHPVAGRENCLLCHQKGVTTKAMPANHAGRDNNTCQVCHKTAGSIAGAPNIPHPVEGRADCLMCHKENLKAPAFPANHSTFTNEICASCHKATR